MTFKVAYGKTIFLFDICIHKFGLRASPNYVALLWVDVDQPCVKRP